MLAERVIINSIFRIPFKVLVVITDGEITSGDFSDLDKSIVDLSSLLVETYVVAQGDDIVEEGLLKIANTKDFNHLYSLTPVRKSVPDTTQSLASAICNCTFSYLHMIMHEFSALKFPPFLENRPTLERRLMQRSAKVFIQLADLGDWPKYNQL